MDRAWLKLSLLSIALAPACGALEPATAGRETDTDDPTSDGGSSTGSDDVGVSDGPTGDDESDGTDGSDGTDTGTDTDGEQGADLELLILREDASGLRRYFRFRVVDGIADGPVLAHEATNASWGVAVPMPDHRVVYHTNALDGGEDELRLGTLDDPLPAQTTPILTGIGVGDWPQRIPGTDSLLQVYQDALHRIDLDGLSASAPVEIAPLPPSWSNFALDPQGRHVFVKQEGTDGATDLAYISLADPEVQAMTSLGPDGLAGYPSTTPSGDHGFFTTSEEDVARIYYSRFDDGGPSTPVPVYDDIVEPDGIEHFESAGTRPTDDAVGAAYGIGPQFGAVLHYLGIEDGAPLAPLPLHDASESLTRSTWSPEGTSMTFETYDADAEVYRRWVAQFGLDQQPTVEQIDPGTTGQTYVSWTKDGRWLFLSYGPDGGDFSRVATYEMTDAGPIPGPVYSGEGGSMSMARATTSARYMFLDERVGEQIHLLAVDVSGDTLGDPVLVNGPLGPDELAQFPQVSSDDRFVGYSVRTDIFDVEALWIVSMDAPGKAFEVTDAMIGWEFIVP